MLALLRTESAFKADTTALAASVVKHTAGKAALFNQEIKNPSVRQCELIFLMMQPVLIKEVNQCSNRSAAQF